MKGTELTVTTGKTLDTSIGTLINANDLSGFQKAEVLSKTVVELQDRLTDEYMKPIMKMQGLKIGFKTDKDQAGGYPVGVVRNCLIEAVVFGVQPTGNQFNIIAGNAYITKEGYGYLLSKISGLDFDIIHDLPRISQDKKSAAVESMISWSINGGPKNEKKVPLAIKSNEFMGADGVIGKATRKARKWLYEKITGIETSDGDTQEIDYKIVKDGQQDQEVKTEKVKDEVKTLFGKE